MNTEELKNIIIKATVLNIELNDTIKNLKKDNDEVRAEFNKLKEDLARESKRVHDLRESEKKLYECNIELRTKINQLEDKIAALQTREVKANENYAKFDTHNPSIRFGGTLSHADQCPKSFGGSMPHGDQWDLAFKNFTFGQ
jgi:chromosome segregation ATPase